MTMITDIVSDELAAAIEAEQADELTAEIAHSINSWLWFSAVAYLPGFVGISVLDPYKHNDPISMWADGGDETRLASISLRAASFNLAGWGVHLNMAARSEHPGPRRRGSRSACRAVCSLWTDIDNADQAVFDRLMSFSPVPSAIANTGGGWHAYWTLLPFVESTDDLNRWKRIQPRLTDLLGGDSHKDGGALDISASMRMPGTVNTKPSRGNIVDLVYAAPVSVVYTIDDFAQYDPGEPVRRVAAPRVATVGDETPLTPEEIAHFFGGGKEHLHNNEWFTCCPLPSHGKGKGDNSPSLTISKGITGATIFKCFAGCDTNEIVNTIATRMRATPAQVYGTKTRPMTMAEMRLATKRKGR